MNPKKGGVSIEKRSVFAADPPSATRYQAYHSRPALTRADPRTAPRTMTSDSSRQNSFFFSHLRYCEMNNTGKAKNNKTTGTGGFYTGQSSLSGGANRAIHGHQNNANAAKAANAANAANAAKAAKKNPIGGVTKSLLSLFIPSRTSKRYNYYVTAVRRNNYLPQNAPVNKKQPRKDRKDKDFRKYNPNGFRRHD